MRKLLYTFATLAGMLAVAASCQRETPEGRLPDGDLIDVSMNFTVDDGRPATKAIGDGTTASVLTFYAYDEHGNYLYTLSSSATISYNASSLAGTVSLKVVKGMKYQFVMLATAPSAIGSYYTVDAANKTLAVNYSSIATAQKEDSDFFYFKSGVTSFTASGESKTATLKRPLAQLNVGSTAEDFAVATNSGINTNTMQTGYVLTGIPNQLSLLDGNVNVSGTENNITLAPATRPLSDLTVGSDTYKWVSTAYVLMSVEGQTTDVTLNVTMTNNQEPAQTLSPISRSITAVPLKRNYRTNILGNIFSIDAVFNVSVDSDFEDADEDDNPDDINVDYVSVSNVENLNTELEANKDKEVDQSYTVSTVEDNSGSSAHTSTIEIPTGTKAESLTFQLGTIESGVTKIIVKDEDASAGEYAKTVTVEVPAGADLSTITFTVETPSAHVVIKSGGNIIHELNAATGGSTLVVAEGTKIEKLVVKEGNVQIEKGGTVKDIQRAAGNEADIYVEMAAGAVWTNMDTNVAADAKLFPEHTIASVADFKAFRDAVNADDSYTFKGITVNLTSDLDLGNEPWTPIGLDSYVKNFKGVFDGQNHTISKLKVTHAKTAGLFGCMNQGAVRNLVVDGLEITSNHYAGGIVAWIEKGAYDIAIDHCIVKNGTIASSPELVDSKYDNGDKVGGIIGYAYKPTGITDNTVVNLTITAYRDLAGVAGYATATTITGNTVKDVNIIQSLANGYKAEVPTTIGAIVGRTGDPNTVDNNTEVNVTISTVLTEGINVNAEGQYVIVSKKGFENFRDLVNAGNPFSGKTFILDTDIDLNNELWEPIGVNIDGNNKFLGVFDGQNHSISRLYVNLTETPANRGAGLFGAIQGSLINLNISDATVKNLITDPTANGTAVAVGSMGYGGTIENVHVRNAYVEGNRRVAGIVGYVQGKVLNCSVEDIELIAKPDYLSNKWDNGDKVGCIAGQTNAKSGDEMSGNIANNFSITAYRDMGGIIGAANVNLVKFENNKASNGTITIDQTGMSATTPNAAAVVGRILDGSVDSSNTYSEVSIVQYLADGVVRQGNVVTVTSSAKGCLKAATEGAHSGDIIKLAAGLSFDAKADWGCTSKQPVPFCPNKTIVFEGGDGTTIDFGHGYYEGTYQPIPPAIAERSHLTFKNIHLINGTNRSDGGGATPEGCALLREADELNFEDCTFSGVLVTVNNPKITLTNCVFNETDNCKYTFWIHSKADVVATNCIFHVGKTAEEKTDGWIKIYADGSENITLSLTNCSFVGTSDEDTHNIKVDAKNNYVITATGCTSETATSENKKFIQVKSHAITFNGSALTAGSEAGLPQ